MVPGTRFAAELTVTLHDGRTITECFNQAAMAHFVRSHILARLSAGEALLLFDGDCLEVPAEQVADVALETVAETDLTAV